MERSVTPERAVRTKVLAVAVVLALLLLLVAGAASASPTSTPTWVKTAQQRLANLGTKAAVSMSGYSRDKFGPAWFDVDLNGCNTRNDILARDLRQVTFKNGSNCIVATGTLKDPYTATTINFVQGPMSSKIQIDHVVALAAAWRTGAQGWTADRRLFYANDSLVLLAVDGPANNAKSDKDAADWLPPNASFDCRYVARQVAIKTKYELWVTQPERMAMSSVLSGC
jgi:type IV secretory pathway VirB2 component (pilin)